MPLLRPGLGRGLLERIKERVKREIGWTSPEVRGPARSVEDKLMRIREAVMQDPPKLVRALYQAKDAPGPTWRNLECYEIKESAAPKPYEPRRCPQCKTKNGGLVVTCIDCGHPFPPRPVQRKAGLPNLYAWCDKDPDKQIEMFHVEKFGDIQVLQTPFSPRWPLKIR